MIDSLLDPASLPDKTTTVSLVQTHISIVFVADEYVYKVIIHKKYLPKQVLDILKTEPIVLPPWDPM